MTRPIRTLLFSTLFPSSARPAHGIFVETRLRELLRSGEVETQVIAPVPWFPFRAARFGEYSRMASTPTSEARNGIEVHHPRYPLPPKVGTYIAPFALALGAWPTVQQILRSGFDFDLIDAHYYYPDGVAAALLAAAFKRPFVVTARGSDLHLLGRDPVARYMIVRAAKRAAASIGVCKGLADVLFNWGIAEERVHVMRNGVDLERFRPRPTAEARLQLGIHGVPLLLTVANLVDVKGHDLTIDAIARLRHRYPLARLVLVGDGPLREVLQAQARRLGIESAVQLVGSRPQEELATWYSAADAFVLASRSEGWANVLLEAIACGTPIVATDVGAAREVIDGSGVGVVTERDAEHLACAIDRLCQMPPSRQAVRRHAEGFSWQATTTAQIELFRAVALGSSGATGATRAASTHNPLIP